MSTEIKYVTARLGLIPELYEDLETLRCSVPKGERLNKSAFVRKILYEYVKAHRIKKDVPTSRKATNPRQ